MTGAIAEAKRRPAGQAGFTLIELLVVIIILGVLSAVVVFAVRGAGDKGKGAALGSDERSIRTAQEAYCAKAGHYARTMGQLTGDEEADDGQKYKFLSEPSEYHDLRPQPPAIPGSCNGTGFEIICKDGSDPPCIANDDPLQPVGKWIPIADLPSGLEGQSEPHVVAMQGTGRLVKAGSYGGTLNTLESRRLWQYGNRQWREMTTHIAFPLNAKSAVAIPGVPSDECPVYCGKVLIHLDIGAGDQDGLGMSPEWLLYDPELDVITQVPRSTHRCFQDSGTLVPLADGRIFRVGCMDNYFFTASNKAEIFDPKLSTAPWVPVANGLHPHGWPMAVRLLDDRILVVGGGFGAATTDAQIYDPDSGWSDATSSPLPLARGNSAVLLGDGRVLVTAQKRVLLYTPGAFGGTWAEAPLCGCGLDDAASGATATVLSSSRVLVAGGGFIADDQFRWVKSAALFNPTNDTWIPVPDMPSERAGSHSFLLSGTEHCPGQDCGKVLLAGGQQAWTTSILFSETGAD